MMMRRPLVSAIVPLLVSLAACGRPDTAFDAKEIIGLERTALEHWGKGDPDGYLSIMASDISYFDPTTATRIDGREALKPLLESVRGRMSIDKAELLNPSVTRTGNIAVLTFNLISRGASLGGSPKQDVKWNATEIYRKVEDRWFIVHSHWALTTPPSSRS